MASLDKIHLDLNEFKLRLYFHRRKDPLVLHFDKPSRKFYFSLIVLIVVEIKKQGKPEFVHIRKHEELIKLLDKSLAGQYASKTTDRMWEKIRTTWHYSLPDLEAASNFKIIDRDLLPPYEKGGKYRYDCTDEESDVWSALFETDENNKWRFKLAVDSVSLDLDNVIITMGNLKDLDAWKEFTGQLLQKKESSPNIEDPVPVYRVLSIPKAVSHGVMEAKKRVQKPWRKQIAITAGALIVIVTMMASWNFYFRGPNIEPASVEKMAYPLPEKPSIAVLAFDNLTGDPEQEYLIDGLSDNIITALAKLDELFVIARNSSFTYKGRMVKVQQVSQELGVRYLLEGSLQKFDNRVRITTQLIDAIKGQHLWAEKYDYDIKDIFKVQDEITMKIVSALRVKLTWGEQSRILAKNISNLDVYLKVAQATSLWDDGTKESLIRFGQLGQEIVDTEPESPVGYRLLGWYHWGLASNFMSTPQENLKKAFAYAQKALSLDETDAFTYALLGSCYMQAKQFDQAIESGKRSVELMPNGAVMNSVYGIILTHAEKPDEAIVYLKQAIRLRPFSPWLFYAFLGTCYIMKGQYVEALAEFQKALQLSPENPYLYYNLALVNIFLDKNEEARALAEKVLKMSPNYSVTFISNIWPYKTRDGIEIVIDAMRKAGFPE